MSSFFLNKVPLIYFDVESQNERIYTYYEFTRKRDNGISLFDEMELKSKNFQLIGQIGFPDYDTVNTNLSRASFYVNNLTIGSDGITGDINLLNNEDSKILKNLASCDLISFRPASLGNVLSDNTVQIIKFIGFFAIEKNDDPYSHINKNWNFRYRKTLLIEYDISKRYFNRKK